MNRQQIADLHRDMGTLAAITSDIRWDEAEAKPIGQRNWSEALVLALIIDREVPGLPVPVPGADPDGFIWLTWRTESREFALELRFNILGRKYAWSTLRDGMKQRHESDSLRDMVESLRATFGDTEAERSSLIWMPN